MNTYKILSRLIGLLLAYSLMIGSSTPALAAEFCSDEFYIDVTLPNQARWDMCWEHRQREGIVYHKIHYTPRNGTRRMILNEAAIAQIHVPYDDNGARYHDVTDYGLGARYMVNLAQTECLDGKLLSVGNKNVTCQQIESRDSAFHYGSNHLQGDALSLFSVSKIGAYNYIPVWRFLDDGSIEPGMGATGALQRFGNSEKEKHGWLVAQNKIGLAHLHNFFWKLDFDLAGTRKDDYVEELNFIQENGKTRRTHTRFNSEIARKVAPEAMRRWRVVDSEVNNEKGKSISYEIRLHQSEHKDVGPETEPFTHNDIYVTKHKGCELFASHNPTTSGCADNLAAFTDGENIAGEDIIVWPSTTFYHMPRAEDAPRMDAHWSFVSITPRDWHDKNPLSDSIEVSGSSGSNTTGGGTNTNSSSGNTTILYSDNFESTNIQWTSNPTGSDDAYKGAWEIGNPQATSHRGMTMQRDDAVDGYSALVTGASAGKLVGSNDVDGGITSIRSPLFTLPAEGAYQVKLSYYLAHLKNTTADDFLRITAISENGNRKILLFDQGSATDRPAEWKSLSGNITEMAGSRVWLTVEASDGGTGSIIEAAIDNIRIEQTTRNSSSNPSTGTQGNNTTTAPNQALFADDFESANNWTLNPAGDDTAYTGTWESGTPEHTEFQSTTVQLGGKAQGNQAMVTGLSAGATVGAHDVDGGKTSIRSPLINIPANGKYQLTLDYYFAHLWNTTEADYFKISVLTENGAQQQVLYINGSSQNRAANWQALTYDLDEYAGSSLYLLIETADGDTGSIIEAAVDNIRITNH